MNNSRKLKLAIIFSLMNFKNFIFTDEFKDWRSYKNKYNLVPGNFLNQSKYCRCKRVKLEPEYIVIDNDNILKLSDNLSSIKYNYDLSPEKLIPALKEKNLLDDNLKLLNSNYYFSINFNPLCGDPVYNKNMYKLFIELNAINPD